MLEGNIFGACFGIFLVSLSVPFFVGAVVAKKRQGESFLSGDDLLVSFIRVLALMSFAPYTEINGVYVNKTVETAGDIWVVFFNLFI